jgi:hypothetical protein
MLHNRWPRALTPSPGLSICALHLHRLLYACMFAALTASALILPSNPKLPHILALLAYTSAYRSNFERYSNRVLVTVLVFPPCHYGASSEGLRVPLPG